MTLNEWLSPNNPDEVMWRRIEAGLEPDITPQEVMAFRFEHGLIEMERARHGFPKGLYGPSKEPVLLDGKLGWIRVFCKECKIDYDIREVNNETTHPAALHVARFAAQRATTAKQEEYGTAKQHSKSGKKSTGSTSTSPTFTGLER